MIKDLLAKIGGPVWRLVQTSKHHHIGGVIVIVAIVVIALVVI
jgi:hypothetical protein